LTNSQSTSRSFLLPVVDTTTFHTPRPTRTPLASPCPPIRSSLSPVHSSSPSHLGLSSSPPLVCPLPSVHRTWTLLNATPSRVRSTPSLVCSLSLSLIPISKFPDLLLSLLRLRELRNSQQYEVFCTQKQRGTNRRIGAGKGAGSKGWIEKGLKLGNVYGVLNSTPTLSFSHTMQDLHFKGKSPSEVLPCLPSTLVRGVPFPICSSSSLPSICSPSPGRLIWSPTLPPPSILPLRTYRRTTSQSPLFHSLPLLLVHLPSLVPLISSSNTRSLTPAYLSPYSFIVIPFLRLLLHLNKHLPDQSFVITQWNKGRERRGQVESLCYSKDNRWNISLLHSSCVSLGYGYPT
jgi:hypothetical protein